MNLSDKSSNLGQLEVLAKLVSCVVVILRRDGKIVFFNPFAEKFTGLTAKEVVNSNFCSLFPNTTGILAAVTDSIEPSQARPLVTNCQERLLQLTWSFQPLEEFEGEPAVLAVASVRSEFDHVSQGLQNQAAWLQAIMETAIDGIIMIDESGEIQTINPAVERIFGYAAEAMLGNNISMLMPMPYKNEHDEYLKNYLRTGCKKIIGVGREVTALRKSGEIFPCEIAVSELIVGGRRVFSGVVRDISEQRRAQDALRERESFLQTIFETEPECVSVHSRNGELQRINRAGLQMIEADSVHQVRSRNFCDLVASEHQPAYEKLSKSVFEGHSGSLQFDVKGLRGATRKLEMHAVPLRNTEGQITALLGVTRDITEQIRAESRALQAERLAAIGETVAGLAHESRNAFQRSQACLEMLAIELEGRPCELQLVHRTQKALDHLHRLYEEVRDYAAPINLDKQVCDVAHIWRDAWSHLEMARRDKAVLLEELVKTENLDCDIDWFALGQVFRNVFENGIAACPTPGKITLECSDDALRSHPALRISIRDNGEGIDPASKDHVFDAFFTTKTKGTGLGMAIARRIVETHGGRIVIGDSKQRQGAEFIILIPRR